MPVLREAFVQLDFHSLVGVYWIRKTIGYAIRDGTAGRLSVDPQGFIADSSDHITVNVRDGRYVKGYFACRIDAGGRNGAAYGVHMRDWVRCRIDLRADVADEVGLSEQTVY